jgi:AcrR family transcriptional regulator
MATGTGLRERKREQTRRTLNEVAVRLFLERGFDEVTVAEIAEEANVALTTLFTYYPEGKVALVFAQDEDRAEALTQAVRDREPGTDVLAAVEHFMASRVPFGADDPASRRLLHLIFSTPQLRAYVRTRWTDCEDVLTALLAAEGDSGAVRALARFILESPDIAARADAPEEVLAEIFARLRRGWGRDEERG